MVRYLRAMAMSACWNCQFKCR